MKMNGILHVVDFKTEQIVAAIQAKDYWDDMRHWELKNNIDTLEFTTFDGTDQAVTLQQQNLILKQVRDGRIVPYVLSNEVERDSKDRSITVHAAGAWVLLAKAGIIRPQRIESKTLNEFVDMALAGTKWKRGKTEYAGFHTMTIDEFIDPLTFLKKIASLFGMEIQYRVEVIGSQIVGWYVDMVKKRGRETGKEVTLGKDLVGVRRIEHSRDICTALVGFVRGEGDELITIESINNGIPYITDSDAFQRWSENGQHKFGFYTPETEEQNMTPQRLMTLMKTEFQKRVNTSVSYEVEAADISKVFGLSHEEINEGDTIRIKDTGFTPKLYLEARAIAADESFTDPTKNKYTFGDYREIVDPNEELRKMYNRILSTLGSKANKELLEQLEKLVQETDEKVEIVQKESEAAKQLAEKVQENLKNYQTTIIESVNPPTTGLEDGKTLWLDISNGKPGILKLWKNGDWEPVVPDVESVKQEAIEHVNKEIESTKKELDEKVQAVQNETTGQYNEVKESLEGVSRTISNVQNEQGNINKKVTQIEQTSEGFKTSIEELTKQGNEIGDKVNTIEHTVEGTQQTIADIKSTTDGLTKTTTEIKEQAGKITEKMSSLEKREVNVRNYVINSDFSNSNNNWVGITNPVTTKIIDVNIPEVPTIKKGLQVTSNKAFIHQNLRADLFKKKRGVVSCYVDVKTVTSTNEFPRLYMRFTYDQNGTNKNYYAIISQKEITNGWERISVPFDTTKYAGTLKEVRVNLATANTTTVDATFTGIMVTFGDLLESWNLALEDGVTQGAFTEKTTEIEKSVDGIKENIAKVENTQTSFDKRVTNVEKTAEGITQNVSKLQETQTQQGKAISEAQTTIKQHSDRLDLAVQMKDVESYVGGIGNTNLILNSVLKENIKHWYVPTETIRDVSVIYKGAVSFRTITSGLTVDSYKGAVQTIKNNGDNWDFVYSAYFYTDNKASVDKGARIEVICLDGSGNRLKTYQQEITLVQGVWTRSFVTGQVVAGTKSIQAKHWLRRNGRLWGAQPLFQSGTKPSSFMENPSDIVDKDKIMEELADKVATEQYTKKVTELERKISANEKGVEIISEKHETFVNDTFDAYVKETGSKLQVLDEGILAQVKKGDIIAAINMSAEKITIDVAKLAINADTMVKWLTAKGIDTNLIRISGDKILIDKNGVTIKMLDFLFEDERGLKTTVQAKRNLVIDHDFSSVPKQVMPGNTAFSWFETGRFWRKNGSVVIENDTLAFSYERMVNATRVDKNSYVETTVKNGVHPGNIYTVSAHFRAATINGQRVTAKPVIQILYVKYDDNVHYTTWYEVSKSFDAPSTFYGDIQRRAFTITIPASYKPTEHAVIIRLKSEGDIGQGTAVCVSGVEMVTGKYPSMYSWQAQSGSVYGGIMPIDGLEFGDSQGTINVAQDRKTFDIGGTLETKFHNNIRATQGVNLGGNGFQDWGHIRFADGNQGIGFYVHNSNGWFFNRLG